MTPDSQEIMEPKRDARYDNQMPSLNSCSIISCRVYSTTNLSSCMRPSFDRSIAQEVASWSRTTKKIIQRNFLAKSMAKGAAGSFHD